mgnify:CR=1 FL=1
MKILLTNDDGYFASGVRALQRIARQHVDDVFLVAPAAEQSGISQAITFLRPLTAKPVVDREHSPERIVGYSVNGTPADCVKLGLHELCPWQPDVIISGINAGLNVGINVCHSGTVGGAFSAAMFGVPAIAVSLEASRDPDFDAAAKIAWPIITKVLQHKFQRGTVININIPASATQQDDHHKAVVVPVELNPLGYQFQKGTDPKDIPFFWATNHPAPKPSSFLTDTVAMRDGKITISAITYDMNCATGMEQLEDAFSSVQREPADSVGRESGGRA